MARPQPVNWEPAVETPAIDPVEDFDHWLAEVWAG
jgi:hypothetical protein